MNNARRKVIHSIVSQLEELMAQLNAVRDEEQEAFDNMPEGLQDSERGCAMQEGLDTLSEMEDALENARDLSSNLISA